jgi:hypothetical protein
MAYCIYCGAEMNEDSRFWRKCGGPRLQPGEKLEPIRIDAPEGATVTISDAPPEVKNAQITARQAAEIARKAAGVITKVIEADEASGEMILTDWEEEQLSSQA